MIRLLVALLFALQPDHSLVVGGIVKYHEDSIAASKDLPLHLAQNPLHVTNWFPSTVQTVVEGSVFS